MNKKGFTLMELVAVIVVLALVALISLPIIINSIDSNRKQAYKVSVTNILKAIETEIANNSYQNLPVTYIISEEGIKNKYSLNISDIEYNGQIEGNGYAYINSYESSSICVCNNKYCATKSYTDKEIEITKKVDDDTCTEENLDKNLTLDDISETDTVEINTEYTLLIPTIYDTEGEQLEIEYEILNSSNIKIGDNTTTNKISSEYTGVLNDTILVNYSVYDESINELKTKSQTITVVDTITPTLSLSIASTSSSYNTLSVNLSISAIDQTNMQMYISQTGYEENGSWETYANTKSMTLTGTLDGTSRTLYVTIKDEGNNKTEKQITYTPYKECSNKTSNTTYGTCTSSCTKSSTITYTDRYTGKTCSTTSGGNVSCTGGSCSDDESDDDVCLNRCVSSGAGSLLSEKCPNGVYLNSDCTLSSDCCSF